MNTPEKQSVYNIIEIANVHGGDFNYLKSLIHEFEPFQNNYGMKFQPFKYDEIALEDFSWYEVYKKLFFSEDKWDFILKEASKTKDIWIDVFDRYSVHIIQINLPKICGIKFQASILDNKPIIDALAELDLSNIWVILNISSYSMDQIQELVDKFSVALNPKEIILQIGFQDYPTDLKDCGLSKIKSLQKHFSNSISFADHMDQTSENARMIPVFASLLGASFIEKHVMHSSMETKYDFYSSLKVNDYQQYIDLLYSDSNVNLFDSYSHLLDTPFINEKEQAYLKKTLQIPIFNKDKTKGSLINIGNDFVYKRTDQRGLNCKEVNDLIMTYHLLNKKKQKGTVLKVSDLRKTKIAAIIACRLKSNRLPKKALLMIGNLTSVELCIKNTLKFSHVDHTILATSTEEEDAELKDYTFHEDVIFHRGDPDDVIQRYLDIINRLSIDVVIRITADMPYVSDEILQILLKSHFSEGADYTTATQAAVGTNLEIINTLALKRVKKYFPRADYSEYMTYYFQNNPSYFMLNYVELPGELVRDYRLTLDYPKDLEMFNIIEQYFMKENLEFTLNKLFDYLDAHLEVVDINKDYSLKYKTDKKLINTLKKYTKIKV